MAPVHGRCFILDSCLLCGSRFFCHPPADDLQFTGCISCHPHSWERKVSGPRFYASAISRRIPAICHFLIRDFLVYPRYVDLPHVLSYRQFVFDKFSRGGPWTYSPFDEMVQITKNVQFIRYRHRRYRVNRAEPLDRILTFLLG